MTLNSNINEIGNKSLHSRHDIKIVTNHVIFDKWTRDNQIIELLGKILEKKGPRNRERP